MKRSARLRLGRSRTSRCHDIFLLCWPSSLCLLSSTLHPSPFCSVTGRAVWVHPRSPQPSGPQLDAADGRHRLEAGGWRLAGEEARVFPSSLSLVGVCPKKKLRLLPGGSLLAPSGVLSWRPQLLLGWGGRALPAPAHTFANSVFASLSRLPV